MNLAISNSKSPAIDETKSSTPKTEKNEEIGSIFEPQIQAEEIQTRSFMAIVDGVIDAVTGFFKGEKE